MKKRYMMLGVLTACLSFGSLSATVLADNKISMEEAKAIALSKIPGGAVSSIELEHKLGKAVYEVEVYLDGYEYDLKIDAATGTGISVKKELQDDYKSNLYHSDAAAQAVITQEEAEAIAIQQIPGASIIEMELDDDKGKAVYELEAVKDGYEYDLKIDAVTGSVLKCKIDD